ncbi:PAAR domain-containing protein [Pseudomonas resinovorans]|uniref:PAAR domain-containing protein n=1 Tax=Metapseudomonas resinovorans TaxID=53412 RepID=A0ABT4YD28_METRE|nr:PAAR domain-containing protein [Pseudomonas resinovorans]MDA8486658.1 PAAR domain-containing protein [Pseudomonas resinovorans]
MAIGHFIHRGDRTTCGGVVLDGELTMAGLGNARAREGDRVTCGEDGETYVISGGLSHIRSHGQRVAGTLDSVSSCPCRAQLIPAVRTLTYWKEPSAAPQASPTEIFASNQASASEAISTPTPLRLRTATGPSPASSLLMEPGFYIVPKSMSGEQVLAELAPSAGPAARLRLRALNPTFAQGFKAGELFVLGDSRNDRLCTREEAQVMLAAAQARTALEQLSPTEADFMVRYQAEFAGMLANASQSMEVARDVFEVGLKRIASTVRELEHLHQREFAAHGHLRTSEFFASRQQLYRQLNLQLKTTFLNKQLGLGSYDTLRRDLGISAQSLVHHWSQSGAPGQTPGYATHLDEVAQMAKYVKYGGHFAIVVGGASSALKVQEVCQAGESQACQKLRLTETGSFAGGVARGMLLAEVPGQTGVAICSFLGLGTMSTATLACGLAVVGAGSHLGAAACARFGELMGEEIYRMQQ